MASVRTFKRDEATLNTEECAQEVDSQQAEVYEDLRLIRLRQNEPSGKLGFSLRGGKEASGCSVGVFVSHVELAGQASKNGLRVGDQLIQVNGLQVSRATYDEVIELIRRTPKREEIRLLVTYVGQIPFQESSGKPIGWLQLGDMLNSSSLSLINRNSASSSSASNKTQAATKATTISHCDKANGYATSGAKSVADTTKASSYQDDSAASSQSLTLTSASNSSFGSAAHSTGSSADSSDDDGDDVEEDACAISPLVSSASSSTSGCSISMSSVQSGSGSGGGGAGAAISQADMDVDETNESPATPIRVPGGRRTSEPFGCGVVKGPEEWPGIFVQHVKEASLAERVGLEPGDQLLKAEQCALDELPFEEAIKLIKRLQAQQDELLLEVRKGAALKHLAKGRCKAHQRHTPPASVASSQATNSSAIGSDDSSTEWASSNIASSSSSSGNSGAQAARALQTGRPLPRRPAQSPPAPPRAQRALQGEAGAREGIEVTHLEHNSISSAIESGAKQACRQRARPADCSSGALNKPLQQHKQQPQRQADSNRLTNSAGQNSSSPELAGLSASCEPQATNPIERCESPASELLGDELEAGAAEAPSALARTTRRPDHTTRTSCSPNLVGASIRAQDCTKMAKSARHPIELDATASWSSASSDQADQISNVPADSKYQASVTRARKLDDQREQAAEQIKIVRQNCKLHQHGANSLQHLVKMSPFAKEAAKQQQHQQHQQQHKTARRYQQANLLATTPAQLQQQTIKQSQDLKQEVAREQRFAPALQHYISMDNLASRAAMQRCNSSRQLDRLHSSQALAAAPPPQQLAMQQAQFLHPPTQRVYRRSNSVLGQTANMIISSNQATPANACCQPAASQFYASPNADCELLQAQSGAAYYRTSCHIGATCGCAPAEAHQVASMATLRHLQTNQRILFNGRYKRQTNNTLAMSKFKARSEDKLNLMNVNLNYVQIGNLNECSSNMAGRTLKAKQHFSQPQILCQPCNCRTMLPTSNRTPRRFACNQLQPAAVRTLCTSRNVRSGYPVCLEQRQQAQQVFHYATAMGMISNSAAGACRRPANEPAGCTLKALSSAKSCCAINQVACGERAASSKRVAGSASSALSQSDTDDTQAAANSSCVCDTISCSSSFYCASEQQLLRMHAPASRSGAKLMPSASHEPARKQRASQNGASTDSSGYQSGCNQSGLLRGACVLAPPATPSRQRETGGQKLLSTFAPLRPASRTSVAPQSHVAGKQTSLVMLANGGASNSLACSPSSLISSSCSSGSPASSTGLQQRRHQKSHSRQAHESSLSPASSMSPSSHSPASSRSASPQANPCERPSKQLIGLKQSAKQSNALANALKAKSRKQLAKQQANERTKAGAELIPRPPPMPIVGPDGRTLTRPSGLERQPTICNDLPPKSCAREQPQTPAAAAGVATKQKSQHAINQAHQQQQQQHKQVGKLNRLSFVDELKMLASGGQQAEPAGSFEEAHSKSAGSAHSGANCKSAGGEPAQHVDSATLIKLINANNRLASHQRKQQQQQQQQLNCSSCCQLAKSSGNGSGANAKLLPASACCYAQAIGAAAKTKFASSTAAAAAAASAGNQLESKSVKLRDEEDNKRRQHELLMEEFKTAHSKMFNKLRQTNGLELKQEQLGERRASVESGEKQTVASADSNNNQELKQLKSSG